MISHVVPFKHLIWHLHVSAITLSSPPTVDSVEAAGVKKAVQHLETGSMVGTVDWRWTMVGDRCDKLEVRQIGEVWWSRWQKQQVRPLLQRSRAVVQQWQQVTAKATMD